MNANQQSQAQSTIDNLKLRVAELEGQRTKLEDELRPHRDRDYKEKQRAEDDKRVAERDQRIFDNVTRCEALVAKAVKDPQLKETAFAYALQASMMSYGPFTFMR